MKNVFESAGSLVRKTSNRVLQSKEARWAAGGGMLGSAAALAAGVTGVGLAGAFGGIAIPGVLLVGVPAAFVGSRIGIALEKREASKAAAEAVAAASAKTPI